MTRARILADYVSSGDELALKAPIAGPTFTGTVAIPNVANLETAVVANTAKVSFTPDAAQVFNDTGADVDFRIESDDDANVFFVDGGEDRVGIGESVPFGKLHIKTSDTTAPSVSGNADELVLEATGNVGMTIQSANDGVGNIYFGRVTNGSIGRISYDHSSNTMSFRTDATDRLEINDGGVAQFQKNTSGTGVKIVVGKHTLMSKYLDDFYFYQGYAETTGSNLYATSYQTFSDYRLKENIVPLTGAIDRVKNLKTYRFNFKEGSGRPVEQIVDGFLAHEAQEVVPEAVTGEKDWLGTEEYEVTPAVEEVRDEDGNVTTDAVDAVMGEREAPRYQGIDQAKLVPLLTRALQEAITRIETFEAENTALKTRMDALEARVLALEG